MGANIVAYRGLILAAVAINAAVLLFFVLLSVLQFDQLRTGLEQERLKVIADRVSEPLSSAAMIGLDLSTVRNLDAVLERARQADDAIIALHILDPKGAIVKSTLGSALDANSTKLRQFLESAATSVTFKEFGNYRYLRTFKRSSGDIAGALLMDYSGSTATTAVWAMAGRLATWALAFCVISSLASAWIISIVFNREHGIDQDFVAADGDALQHLWRGKLTSQSEAKKEGIALAIDEAETQYLRARDRTT